MSDDSPSIADGDEKKSVIYPCFYCGKSFYAKEVDKLKERVKRHVNRESGDGHGEHLSYPDDIDVVMEDLEEKVKKQREQRGEPLPIKDCPQLLNLSIDEFKDQSSKHQRMKAVCKALEMRQAKAQDVAKLLFGKKHQKEYSFIYNIFKTLEDKGLVDYHEDGRNHIYFLSPKYERGERPWRDGLPVPGYDGPDSEVEEGRETTIHLDSDNPLVGEEDYDWLKESTAKGSDARRYLIKYVLYHEGWSSVADIADYLFGKRRGSAYYFVHQEIKDSDGDDNMVDTEYIESKTSPDDGRITLYNVTEAVDGDQFESVAAAEKVRELIGAKTESIEQEGTDDEDEDEEFVDTRDLDEQDDESDGPREVHVSTLDEDEEPGVVVRLEARSLDELEKVSEIFR